MIRTCVFPLGAVLFAVAVSGCATGGSQTQATISDIHRRVTNLDKEMDTTITKLNETTAELSARVEQTDQETRTLRSMSEENQVRLESIERSLNELKAQAYRVWNLTSAPGGAPAAGAPVPGGAQVEIIGPEWSNPPSEPPVTAMTAPPVQPPPAPVSPPPSVAPADVTPVPEPVPVAPPPAPAPVPAPQPVPAAPAPSAGDPQVAYQNAQRSFANEDYEAALRSFDDFLRQYSDSDLRANAQFWKAKCCLNLNRYQEAIGEFERLRTEYPGSTKVPFAMHNQAVAHSRLGQVDEASRLLEEVINSYPTTPAADQARMDLKKLRGES
ncbi:MAG: tol-pal system protein YbgF [Candidatus Hydrogenedentes bacterium]|nr:tol-pal system protein YbgF [Candidatus Hydrogenedentota bacterium]